MYAASAPIAPPTSASDSDSIITAVAGGLEDGGVGPDFRFRRPAAAGEFADDVPVVLPDANLLAHVQPRERPRRAGADDHFIAPGLEIAALDDSDIAAHRKRRF